MDVETRLWASVDVGLCWEWKGRPTPKGYGQFFADGKRRQAHRYVWELLVGPIPQGLQLDHLCRNRLCVNPDHLEPVTPRENTRRGAAGSVNGGRQAAKTHCKQGHEFTPENTYRHGSRRVCRTCGRLNARRYAAASR